MRRFAVVSSFAGKGIELPRRQTEGSAGYDLAAAEEVCIPAGEVRLVPTGLKVYLPPGEFLAVYIRSGLAARRGLQLANGVGIIDADYADNPENEGHILVALYNRGPCPVHITRGERIAQGIFTPYAVTDDDYVTGKRQGGLGSTGPGVDSRRSVSTKC